MCLLEQERDGEWLQAVAAELNISQTGYLTRIHDNSLNSLNGTSNPCFHLRWFTPLVQVYTNISITRA